MRRIWKYDHGISDSVLVVPGGEDARIVHVGQSPYGPRFVTLWVDIPDAETKLRDNKDVVVVGTGHDIPPSPFPGFYLAHVGTVEYLQEGLVWHVLERRRL